MGVAGLGLREACRTQWSECLAVVTSGPDCTFEMHVKFTNKIYIPICIYRYMCLCIICIHVYMHLCLCTYYTHNSLYYGFYILVIPSAIE